MTYNGETPTTDGLYTVVEFLTTGEFVTPDGIDNAAEVLLIGGAGAGGTWCGGGGAAGGVLPLTDVALAGTMSVVVGLGGAAPTGNGDGANGGDTTFAGETAAGGGGGGSYNSSGATGDGHDGGSGGGVGWHPGGTPGAGTAGQGYAGGHAASDNSSGGGGGAAAVGGDAASGTGGAGGAGTTFHGAGYGRGGGGFGISAGGAAGSGGTGNGTGQSSVNGGSGAANTGDGGGGGWYAGNGSLGGAGGSGIVIIRYLTPTGGGSVGTMSGTGVIALGGSANLRNPRTNLSMQATGVIALVGAADATGDVRLAGTSVISLTGYAYLTAMPHGYDTMQGTGVIQVGGSARLSEAHDAPLPPTDDIGWIVPDVTVPAIRGLVVVGLGIPFSHISQFDIELDDQGGPQSAQVVVASDLVKAPAMLSHMSVWYQGQSLFYGRLDMVATNVDSGTGYTLTYGPAMEKLRDHKAHRQVYIDSSLDSWQQDQGPRTAPDVLAT